MGLATRTAFRRSGEGRLVLARDQVHAQTCAYDAAPSSARRAGCALHGASLFLVWPRKSNQKEGHPCIRVLLRKTSLAPALLRGSSRRDIHVPSLLARHPCLAPLCATPTLGLLKGTRDRVVCKFINSGGPPLRSFADQKSVRRRRTPLSGGRTESAWRGASGMDAARGVKGHGRPLYAGLRNADEVREVSRSETRMQGQAFLLTFFAFEKSESPSRAKPMRQPTPLIGHTSRSPSPKPSRPSPFLQKHYLPKQFENFASGPLNPVAPRRTFNLKRPLVCA